MFSENGVIIGEERNIEEKTASFFSLDVSSGRVLWKDKSYGEKWWIGLDAVTDNRLYLHGFKKPDMPEHKNIIAVDLTSGDEIWRNSECSFLAIRNETLYGYKDLFERRVYYQLDHSTGSIIEELKELPAGIELNVQYEKTDFIFPRQLTEHERQSNVDGISFEGAMHTELLETDSHLLFNIYTRHATAQNSLKNTFSIIDTSTKKKVYSDVLNESTQFPVPDSFFLDGSRVYYIRERKTLIALDLRKQ